MSSTNTNYLDHASFVSTNDQNDFVCPICTSILSQPYETSCCGTLTCKTCDDDHRQTASRRNANYSSRSHSSRPNRQNCPYCREPNYTIIGPSKFLQRKMNEALVKCNLCGDVMKLRDFENHIGDNMTKEEIKKLSNSLRNSSEAGGLVNEASSASSSSGNQQQQDANGNGRAAATATTKNTNGSKQPIDVVDLTSDSEGDSAKQRSAKKRKNQTESQTGVIGCKSKASKQTNSSKDQNPVNKADSDSAKNDNAAQQKNSSDNSNQQPESSDAVTADQAQQESLNTVQVTAAASSSSSSSAVDVVTSLSKRRCPKFARSCPNKCGYKNEDMYLLHLHIEYECTGVSVEGTQQDNVNTDESSARGRITCTSRRGRNRQRSRSNERRGSDGNNNVNDESLSYSIIDIIDELEEQGALNDDDEEEAEEEEEEEEEES